MDAIEIRCSNRHELEGHLRTLAIAWPSGVGDGTVRGSHEAARVRLQRATRVLEQIARAQ
jgi:hypothetical protein